MKMLKTSKKDKEGFTQPRGETLIKGFTSNISICLDDAFYQSTRHRNNDLGAERRRILDYPEMDRKIRCHVVWDAIVKVFVGAEKSPPGPRGFDIFHKPHQRTNRCQHIYTPAEKKRLTKIKIARIILAQTVSGLYQHTSITDGEGHNDTQTAIPF